MLETIETNIINEIWHQKTNFQKTVFLKQKIKKSAMQNN